MRRYKQMDIAKRTSRTMKDYPQHYERLKSLIGQLREELTREPSQARTLLNAFRSGANF